MQMELFLRHVNDKQLDYIFLSLIQSKTSIKFVKARNLLNERISRAREKKYEILFRDRKVSFT